MARPVVVLRVGGAGVRHPGAVTDVVTGFVGIRGEVVAGGEGSASTFQDDDADGRIGFGLTHAVIDLAAQGVAQGVELLRAVEGDVGKAVVGLVDDVVVGHGVPSGWVLVRARRAPWREGILPSLAACRTSDGVSRPNADRVRERLGLGQEALPKAAVLVALARASALASLRV